MTGSWCVRRCAIHNVTAKSAIEATALSSERLSHEVDVASRTRHRLRGSADTVRIRGTVEWAIICYCKRALAVAIF